MARKPCSNHRRVMWDDIRTTDVGSSLSCSATWSNAEALGSELGLGLTIQSRTISLRLPPEILQLGQQSPAQSYMPCQSLINGAPVGISSSAIASNIGRRVPKKQQLRWFTIGNFEIQLAVGISTLSLQSRVEDGTPRRGRVQNPGRPHLEGVAVPSKQTRPWYCHHSWGKSVRAVGSFRRVHPITRDPDNQGSS
jgi:hypothetical protein